MLKKAKVMRNGKKAWQLFLVLVLFLVVQIPVAHAQEGEGPLMSPAAGYDLSWWTVDGGGSMFSMGDGYALGGTIGQPDVGMSTAEGYSLTGGFWAGIVEPGEARPL